MKSQNSSALPVLVGLLTVTVALVFWRLDQAYQEQAAQVERLEQMVRGLQRTIREQDENPRFARLRADSIVVERITLTDAQGREAFAVGTSTDRTYLRMSGGDNRANQVLLTVFNDGRKALLFRNEQHKNRIGIATAADGTPFIDLTEDGTYKLTSDRGFTLGQFFESDGKMGIFFRTDSIPRRTLWSVVKEDTSAQQTWPMDSEDEARALEQMQKDKTPSPEAPGGGPIGTQTDAP